MAISVRITDSDATIEKKILAALRDEFNSVLRHSAVAIRLRVAQVCQQLIKQDKTYTSLLHGELLGELGIPDVERSMQAILAKIAESVQVTVIPIRITGGQFVGGLQIGMLKSDFEDLLSMSEASYISAPSGEQIRWLDWLLIQGDRVIVAGYESFFDLTSAQRGRSRTKLALMRKGSGWSVPEAYSGTQQDNFLTRSFDVAGVETLLAKIIQEEIERRI